MVNFWMHFYELKVRFFYLFFGYLLTLLISYVFTPQLITLLSGPILTFVKLNFFDFIFTNIFEVFNTYLVISYYSSLFFYSPIFFYSLFNFFKLGLFEYEKNFLQSLFKVSLVFHFFSFGISFFFLFPSILSFFLGLNLVANSDFIIISIQPKLFDYITFFSHFLFFYSLIMLQFPFLLIIVSYSIDLKPFFFYKKRKLFIILSLFIGCVFSSPDFINFFFIGFPLFIFYEFIIFVSILKSFYNKFFFLKRVA